MNSILNSLFITKDRSIGVNIEGEVVKIDNQKELVSVDVKYDKYYLKALTFYKSDIFPNPVEGDLILINNISYKHDDYFNPIISIHGIVKKIKLLINVPNESTFDFSQNRIMDTLKNQLIINKNLKSNLFLIIDSNDKIYYKLTCLENNELYFINKSIDIPESDLKAKNIIYINNYDEDLSFSKKIIKLTKWSFIEVISGEHLFILLENQKEISDKFLWGKIIEKDEKNEIIKVMDGDKNILKFQKYMKNVELGQYFLFSNYIIKNNIIELNDNSFSYFSEQDLYFSNKINLNLFSVLQFHSIDFKENDNIFNVIKLEGNIEEYLIENNQLEIIINTKSFNVNYKLIPIKMQLRECQGSMYGKEFIIDISQGLLTKINLQINYKSENSFSYEYLYMFFDETNIYDKIKTIEINNKEIKINIFDNFDSKNRVRFNIVNIPFQNEFDLKVPLKDINSKNNSFLVCETFKKDSNASNIYGIFNLNEIYENKPLPLNPNIAFNRYYNVFGNIYDNMKNKFTNDEVLKFIDMCTNKINNEAMLSDQTIFFDEELTISQLKTRMGILISYYLSIKKIPSEKIKDFKKIKIVIDKIESIKNKFSCNQLLKIFSYLLRRFFNKGVIPNLIILSELNKDSHSPYYLANQFNLQEIENMNEYSKLFQGYLQMDSNILYNNKINDYSYSLSIEPLFIVKYHLKSNYEGFFFTEKIDNNNLAWTEDKENIIVINEENLFQRSKYIYIEYIDDENDSKSHAFGISIVFRHESNSHKKKNLKNKLIESPIYYCDDGEIKKLIYSNDGGLKGEDGVMIESLIIDDQSIIISLAKDFIYGELLDYKLFIGKDFTELISKMNIIREKNKDYFNSYNKGENQGFYSKVSHDSSKMEEIKENTKSNKIHDIVRKAIKSGTLEYGDQFYTLDLAEKMIALAEKKGHKELLSPILLELDKALKESKKKES